MPVLGLLVATVLTVNIGSWFRVSQQTPSTTQCTSESIIVLHLRRGLLSGFFEAFPVFTVVKPFGKYHLKPPARCCGYRRNTGMLPTPTLQPQDLAF